MRKSEMDAMRIFQAFSFQTSCQVSFFIWNGKLNGLQPIKIGYRMTLSNLTEIEEVNLKELFADIDWINVNLGELAEGWHQELVEIEEENIRSLMEIGNKSQAVLPPLQKAIDELSTVEGLLGEYCGKLQVMGAEIKQIEELNRGLTVQTANQQRLLEVLDDLLVRAC